MHDLPLGLLPAHYLLKHPNGEAKWAKGAISEKKSGSLFGNLGLKKMIRKSHQRASSRALPRQGPEHGVFK